MADLSIRANFSSTRSSAPLNRSLGRYVIQIEEPGYYGQTGYSFDWFDQGLFLLYWCFCLD